MLAKFILEFYRKTGRLPSLAFDEPIRFVLRMPPQRAIEWLKRRAKNMKITIRWDELSAEAHDKAFTVAKVMNADILQTIYDAIERAKSEGKSFKDFEKDIENELTQKGWLGEKPKRLRTIYDTNMQMAYAHGKFKQQKLIANLYPYWQYIQIQRPSKRHNHSLFHNKIFRHDDPIWNYIYPPSGFNCKCSVIPVKTADTIENGEKYLNLVKTNKDFVLRPATTWKVDTDKYVTKIKNKLIEILNTNKPT